MPCILVGDKHLGESAYTIPEKGKIVKVPKATKLRRYNSYEQDPKTGSGTENPALIKANIERRMKKFPLVAKEAKSKFKMYEVFGKKDSKRYPRMSLFSRGFIRRNLLQKKTVVGFFIFGAF